MTDQELYQKIYDYLKSLTLEPLYDLKGGDDTWQAAAFQTLVRNKLDDPRFVHVILKGFELEDYFGNKNYSIYLELLSTEMTIPQAILNYVFLHHSLNDRLVEYTIRLLCQNCNHYNEMYANVQKIIDYRHSVFKSLGLKVDDRRQGITNFILLSKATQVAISKGLPLS